jgi:FADH2 O2-dependent halogenase
LWHLRFESDLTSLGYVFHGVPDSQQLTAKDMWNQMRNERPVLREILGSPTIAGFPGRLFRTGRLQRLRSQGAGDDWAALPFSVGFIDPLHSTGIAHTLSGIDRLSRILLEHRGLERSALLNSYSQNVIDELRHIDRLVSCCCDSLIDFRLFAACSMLYFAAATTFERLWSDEPNRRPGFLCADDEHLVGLLREISAETHELCESPQLDDRDTDRHIRKIESAIEPYNHVGLFAPDVPNMYSYTAAEK